MQQVGEPEQGIVLPGVVQVEDVLVVDADFADDGAGGFQLPKGRDGLALATFLRCRRGDRKEDDKSVAGKPRGCRFQINSIQGGYSPFTPFSAR